MKPLPGLLALFLGLGGPGLRSEEGVPAAVSDVEVSVTGLRNTNGQIVFCLWRASDPGFPRADRGRPFQRRSSTATESRTLFKAIPAGSYAISVFHDEKGTGKMETNVMGMPRSGIGLSGGFSLPPTFAKAKIAVPVEKPVRIAVTYFD